MSKKFSGKTAAAILEFPNNKILLIKRGTTVFRGYWALPCGKVEAGETFEETVIREVKEETGLVVERAHVRALSIVLGFFGCISVRCCFRLFVRAFILLGIFVRLRW